MPAATLPAARPLSLWQRINPFEDGLAGTDPHLVLFYLNVLLVPGGYYAAIKLGSLAIIKVVRIGFMALSMAALAVAWRQARYRVGYGGHIGFGVFLGVNLALVGFSLSPAASLQRLLTVAPFWIYLNFLAAYLQGRYGHRQLMARLAVLLAGAYVFVIAVFYAGGAPLATLNIYGDDTRGFVSNHFGWASALVICCLLDVRPLLGKRQGGFAAGLWLALVAASGFLLLISGSRSGYLSLALAIAVLVALGRSYPAWQRMLLLAAVFGAGVFLIVSADSAVNTRLRRSSAQFKTAEPRLASARAALHALDTHDERWLTGLGFDYYNEGVWRLTDIYPLKPHNSYFELLVCTGIFGILAFGLGLLAPALAGYAQVDAARFTFPIPLLVIAYFENNLGAGQFLFYPFWFILLAYAHRSRGVG